MTHVPTIARPVIWSPTLAGSGVIAGEHVARGYIDALDADLVRAVHAQRVDGLELVDEVRAERVLERDLRGAPPGR